MAVSNLKEISKYPCYHRWERTKGLKVGSSLSSPTCGVSMANTHVYGDAGILLPLSGWHDSPISPSLPSSPRVK